MAPAILAADGVSSRAMAAERRRYRKVSCRMYGDEKFRQLSRPQPNAQTLWLYLLTGPHTTAVPGLFAAGELQLAEALGWPLLAFRRAWAEIEALDMALADWNARVIWIKNMIRHNPPDNPNVVKGWITLIDEVPCSPLKDAAIDYFEQVLEQFGESFVKPFREPFGKRLDEPSAHGSVKQEQEQEQEQDQEQDHIRSSRRDDHVRASKPTTPKRATPTPDQHRGTFDLFWSRYPLKVAKAAAWKAWSALKPESALVETIVQALDAQRRADAWTRDGGKYIPHAATWLRGRRWEDVVEAPAPAATGTDPVRQRTVDLVAARLALLHGPRGGDQ